MEHSLFLARPQASIHIISWYINTVKTKIEKDNVLPLLPLLANFNVVGLNEFKTKCHISVSGYFSLVSQKSAHPHHSFTCVLVKDRLEPYVTSVGVSVPHQVWFELKCVPDTLLGFCYILSPDSPYFSFVPLGTIQEKIKTSNCNRCVLLSDFNAHCGAWVAC